ncbi:MAG: hypothetical protein CMG67_02640 [Candidatus Marinimicrobia bacterium]|nr:hypothetical protein [Candidatus Neomarinimicrobiota bacterium]|tara:strand:+ start:8497 stop:9633 length:1137 start_codon:yes stop_codon:yes gene_type:complete
MKKKKKKVFRKKFNKKTLKNRKKQKKIKKRLKKKRFKKPVKEKLKTKIKVAKQIDAYLSRFFLKFRPPSFTSIFLYVSRPFFESYYSFQKDRKRKLLKAQEAKEKEQEKIKREKLQLIKKMKEEQLKEEIYYSKELKKDMKIFLREQERETRKQKAKQQQEIIDNLKLSKQIAAFEARQNKEIAELEKAAFKAEQDDYQEILDRISAIRLKYKNLRLESYRQKLQDLGIEVSGDEDKSALLEKEKKLLLLKSEIENTLMPFTRSLRSIAFFCNRSQILGKHLSPLKIMDLSHDTGEVYLKWLDLLDSEDFLLLCYLKDNSIESKKVVLEMKTDPEKHLSVEFDTKSVFQFQETAIDNVVKMIEKERNLKKASEEKKAS